MKRTTIYLEPELEVRLKMEVLRRKQPMAEIVREAVQAYLTREPADGPPGAGAFASGRPDTADRAEAILGETGFGGGPARRPKRAPPRRVKRRA
ncbi:MAG TPA: CopG family transcriptional regulator [Vicinamibacterales bacterium]|nr:CopG family transcriptional regulator [Vicinamibacterales bacterium]